MKILIASIPGAGHLNPLLSIASLLVESGHEVAELHADRSPAQRQRAMQGFRDRVFAILVATNIAARGLDVHHITHVINFDVPNVPEEYVHRIGRTGRAERKGEAFVFVAPDEADLLTRISFSVDDAVVAVARERHL